MNRDPRSRECDKILAGDVRPDDITDGAPPGARLIAALVEASLAPPGAGDLAVSKALLRAMVTKRAIATIDDRGAEPD